MQNSLVNSNALPASYATVVRNEYDALGKLEKKKVGNKSGAVAGTPIAIADNEYNIRGWLLSVNKNYITNASNSDEWFGMQLGYDKNASFGTFTPLYNGNIAGTIWKSEGDQQKRKYDFAYDAANRITAGTFTQYVSGTGTTAVFNTSAGIDFSTTGLTYDANGNILTMQQKGLKLNASPTIDNLTYTYLVSSNKLAKVTDAASDLANSEPIDVENSVNDGNSNISEQISGHAAAVAMEAGLVEGALSKGIGAVDDLGKAAKGAIGIAKGVGILAGAATTVIATTDFIEHPNAVTGAEAAVQAVALGASFIPGIGWGLAVGIGVADAIWGEDFYNWVGGK